jgi:hypothetical protein
MKLSALVGRDVHTELSLGGELIVAELMLVSVDDAGVWLSGAPLDQFSRQQEQEGRLVNPSAIATFVPFSRIGFIAPSQLIGDVHGTVRPHPGNTEPSRPRRRVAATPTQSKPAKGRARGTSKRKPADVVPKKESSRTAAKVTTKQAAAKVSPRRRRAT